MLNSETTSFQHFSPRIPNLYKFWTSDFGKGGGKMGLKIYYMKRGQTNTHTDTQTDYSTTRSNRPSGPIRWKYTRAIHFWKLETRNKNLIRKIWNELFKFHLFLTLQWQNESWCIDNWWSCMGKGLRAAHTEYCAQFYWAQRSLGCDQFWSLKLAPIGNK